jgi:predicted ATP-grasp superfamily ATP-dependent carboligase
MLCAYIGEHHMPLAGGVTVRRVSCAHAGPAADAVKLLKTLDWNGVATVQFHYDPATGKYVFIEINPRFCAGMGTVIRAGFDSPYLLWQSYFEPDRMIPATVKTGVRTRMLGADLQWMISMMKGDPLPPDQVRLSKIRSAVEFLHGFGPGVRDDIFSFGDPLPYVADLAHMVTKRIGMS